MQIPKDVTKVVNVLKKLKDVKAIGLYGSIAMGFADEYTRDFDMIVFCDKFPNKKVREKILKSVVKKWHSAYTVWEFIDVFDTEKHKDCIIQYRKVNQFEDKIKNFKEKLWFDEELSVFVIYTKSLYDPKGLLKKWKRITKKYPDWFRRHTLGLLTGIFRFTRSDTIKKELKRGDINFLNDRVANVKNMLDGVVFALNKTYYYPKWAFKFYPKFKLLPKDFISKLDRFNKIEGISLKEKIEIIDHLAQEVYEIAKKEIPDLNIITKF